MRGVECGMKFEGCGVRGVGYAVRGDGSKRVRGVGGLARGAGGGAAAGRVRGWGCFRACRTAWVFFRRRTADTKKSLADVLADVKSLMFSLEDVDSRVKSFCY